MKLRNKLHGTALALSLFLLMGTATACGSDNNSDSSEKDSTTTAAESSDETTANDASSDSETASSDGLTFVITLYPDDAPITCENFENLVSDGFYDGLTFQECIIIAVADEELAGSTIWIAGTSHRNDTSGVGKRIVNAVL